MVVNEKVAFGPIWFVLIRPDDSYDAPKRNPHHDVSNKAHQCRHVKNNSEVVPLCVI
jgi:hypothetical protein